MNLSDKRIHVNFIYGDIIKMKPFVLKKPKILGQLFSPLRINITEHFKIQISVF